MSRRPGRSVVPAPTRETGRVVAGCRMEAAYRVPRLRPRSDGPWRLEAEKIAWTDRATGLPCVVRRLGGGFLAGYVGVPPDHPLAGFVADAIPRAALRAHGGINYSRRCDEDGPEEVSVCHVHDQARGDGGVWWFGFSCDGVDDLIPDSVGHAHEARRLGIDQIYRDEKYLFAQCTDLASQLDAIRRDPSTPPLRDAGPGPDASGRGGR